MSDENEKKAMLEEAREDVVFGASGWTRVDLIRSRPEGDARRWVSPGARAMAIRLHWNCFLWIGLTGESVRAGGFADTPEKAIKLAEAWLGR